MALERALIAFLLAVLAWVIIRYVVTPALMPVIRSLSQVSKARSRRKQAEVDLLIAREEAKADQEILKATEVTKAEQEKAVALTKATQEKEVAALAVETAELKKKEQTLLGEGEASRARAMMQANKYLPERLAVYREVALLEAESKGKQRQTPDVVMGGTGKADVQDIMSMSLARALNIKPLN